MRGYQHALLITGVVAVLGYTVWFALDKERILAEGELVLFALAPVDPRSLLQGDYMRLSYEIGDRFDREELPPRGYLVFTRDDRGIATFRRLQVKPEPLDADERIIQFRRRRAGSIRNGEIRLGAESYFFEEGTGAKFSDAAYGGMRIDRQGNAVLVGLWDDEAKPIR